VGKLVNAFNQMLTGIQERDAALQGSKDQLELRVQERTEELQREVHDRKRAQQLQGIAYDVTRLLAGSNPMDITLPKVLQLLCEGLDREVGAIWNLNRGANRLECADVWQQPGPALWTCLGHAKTCVARGYSEGLQFYAQRRGAGLRTAFRSGIPHSQ
jgi:hypothetical protein